ncbi:MAG: ClpXP protease specificity-enhancing factor SspB [Pseudomonadota bacterium]
MANSQSPTEPEDLIRYDILAQEALRGVVKKVLQEVARTGLPGEHHFYITFDTGHPGVRISSRMKEKYPEEMTIVVQHQFWDLEATEHNFSIGLSFDSIPESLLVPFAAIRGFFDPSVQFGLQFEAAPENETADTKSITDASPVVSALPSPVKANGHETGQDTTETASKSEQNALTDAASQTQGGTKGKSTGSDKSDGHDSAEPASADVVSLDAFRKK